MFFVTWTDNVRVKRKNYGQGQCKRRHEINQAALPDSELPNLERKDLRWALSDGYAGGDE
jgi:hypothetical protein